MKNIKKLGLLSLAVLNCLAERSGAVLEQILEGRHRSLQSSLAKINALPTIGDYYEILKNANKESLKTIIWRLQKKGLVAKKSNKSHLTAVGENFLRNLQKQKNLSWDGRWRMVFFDVPEKLNKKRQWLNYQLRSESFKPIQKSVFIGKFPISHELFKRINQQGIRNYLRIITVGEVDDEAILS